MREHFERAAAAARQARPSAGRPVSWAALLLCLALAAPAEARLFVVKPAGPGSLPIGDALEKAQPGDEVIVDPGTYRERIELPAGVYLHSSQGAERTILRGDGSGPVVVVRDADTVATLEGFTILGGGSGWAPEWKLHGGGGLLASRSYVRISNNIFRANRLPRNCDVGGAVAALGGHVVIDGNRFEDNVAGRGGAVFARGDVQILANTFKGNRCALHGGAVLVERANAIVERNVFRQNSAAWGGGLCVSKFTRTEVRNNTFVENRASQWGGGAFTVDCEPLVERNLFVGNRTRGRGKGGGFVSGSFGYPTLRENLAWDNGRENFLFREDSVDIPGAGDQRVADPGLDSLFKGDVRPRKGGPADLVNGYIGAMPPRVPAEPPTLRRR